MEQQLCNTPKVSIIIPVYNAGEYFIPLLENIQKQTLREIEIIFVSDCGTDGSYEIAKRYAETDKRIVCIDNTENAGPGVRRNQGIEKANGEYIAFADADDILDMNFYEVLYKEAKRTGCPVVKARRASVAPDGAIEYSNANSAIIKRLEKGISPMFAFVYEHTTAIFSRELVSRTGARNANANQDEDTTFLLQVLSSLKCDELAFANSVVYYYRKNPASITFNKDKNYLHHSLLSLVEKLNFLAKQPYSLDLDRYASINAERRIKDRFGLVLQNPDFTDEDALSFIRNYRLGLAAFLKTHKLRFLDARSHMLIDGMSDDDFLRYSKSNIDVSREYLPDKYLDVMPLQHSATSTNLVHICMIIENASAFATLICLTSIKENKAAETKYEIHLITRAVNAFWLDMFMQMETCDFHINFIERDFDTCDAIKGIEAEGVYKFHFVQFAIGDILPHLNRVLYFSRGSIIQGDLRQLYNFDVNGVAAAAVHDFYSACENMCSGINPEQREFNTRVMLMNLDYMRKYSPKARLEEEISKLRPTVSDKIQWLMNRVYEGKILSLHCRYNATIPLFTHFVLSRVNAFYNTKYTSYTEIAKQAIIINYEGKGKCMPWRNFNAPFAENWRKYCARSPLHGANYACEVDLGERSYNFPYSDTEQSAFIAYANNNISQLKYCFYRICSILAHGELKKYYQRKTALIKKVKGYIKHHRENKLNF